MNLKQSKQGIKNIRAPALVGVLLMLSDSAVIMGSFYLATQIRRALTPYLGPVEFWRIYQPLVYLGMGFVAGVSTNHWFTYVWDLLFCFFTSIIYIQGLEKLPLKKLKKQAQYYRWFFYSWAELLIF